MGMFDIIDYNMKCPVCGNEVTDFQSKDKDCIMSKLQLYKVDNFYTSCVICGTWIEFNLKDEARKKFTINDYEMKFRKKESQIFECSNCNRKVIPIFAKTCPNCNTKIVEWIDEKDDLSD